LKTGNVKDNSAYNVLDHWYNTKSLIILECLILGVFVGFIVVLYRFLLDFVSRFMDKYIFIHIKDPHYIPYIIAFLLLSAFIVNTMLSMQPLISGSGIPQVKGYIFRQIKMPWLSILISKFVAGVLCIGSGLSLGREGPSIQLGAAAGKGFCRIFKRKKIEEKYLVTGGASAGLAAAFNAPLAGVVFALEEVHKNFSPFIVITVLATAVGAEFVSETFYGSNPVLNFDIVDKFPLAYYNSIILLGFILGICGILYNNILVLALDFFSSDKLIKKKYKMYLVFLISGAAIAFIPEITRGGHHLIEPIVDLNYGMKTVLVFLVLKFIFSMFSYGSGAPGGIFLPLLVIGALIGSLYGQLLSANSGMDPVYIQNMVVFAMAGFLTAVVRAPITSCILICEMTGSFTHFLPLTVVVIISYLVPEFFNCHPIYDTLLNRSLKNNNSTYVGAEKCKVLLEKTVVVDSNVENETIKNIKWPENCLLVNIERCAKDYIPRGSFTLLASDQVTFITDEAYAADIKKKLGHLMDDPYLDSSCLIDNTVEEIIEDSVENLIEKE
jgi:H+/Cl- antiporter ClcA